MLYSVTPTNSLQKGLLSLLMILPFTLLLGQTPNLSNPSACRLGLPIIDNNCPDGEVFFQPNLFNINVSNAPGNALGVDVYLKEVHLLINHSWDNDLDISLISPSGATVLLTADNGGGDDNFGDTTAVDCSLHTVFALGACQAITDGVAPFLDNPYAPQENFYGFNDNITDPNATWQLQICDDAINDEGTLEYVNLVFEPINCLPIASTEVTNVDTTSVFLAWDPDFCGTTIIEYGPVGFTPGVDSVAGAQGTIAFAECSPFILSGLAAETDYDIYVRRYCDATSTFSLNSCGVSATTSCQPPPLTILEDFDSESLCNESCGVNCDLIGVWRNAVSSDFDWIVGEGGTPTQGTGPTDDVPGGGKYVYLEATGSDCEEGAEAHLLSGCILLDKQGTDTCHVSFNYHMRGIDIGTLRLEISINGGFDWRTIWERTGPQGVDWQKTYLSLSDYTDGGLLQFRFVGVKGSGSKGDIALDNIAFYGSQDLGYPTQQYFVDGDGDGFGEPGFFVLSCNQNPPSNFVANDQDCDDADFFINPGAPEIACDGKDNNCNGIDDDANLPAPLVQNDTICSGDSAKVIATPQFGGFIFWYDSEDGEELIHFGEEYEPELPENNSPVPIEYIFYAEEFAFQESGDCRSVVRAAAKIVVNPNPMLQLPEAPGICPGDSIDLASLTIEDVNFTGATISFHSSFPPDGSNLLVDTKVGPPNTTFYYLSAINDYGCSDADSIAVEARVGPALTFTPADSFSICREGSTTVSVEAAGGVGPYSYFWSTGSSDEQIDVRAAFLPGTLDAYYLTVTDAEGCFSTDSVQVTTINSIDSMRVVVDNVTSCSGNDGQILMVPLSGQSPFTYSWSGSSGISGSTSGVTDTLTLTGLDQGGYRITITDSSPEACEFILRNVLVQGPAAVVNDIDVDNVSCFGAGDGKICLDVTGTAPTYLWSTGDTTLCIDSLSGGLYSVTITDDPCQTILTDILVEEPDSLVIKPSFDLPSCHDASDGVISVAFFGGTGPYNLNWFNGQSRTSLPDLAQGEYELTLTDFNNCTQLDTLTLLAPDSLEVQVDSLANISCTGNTDGFIRVSGFGGTAPYFYDWSTGSRSSAIANLLAGDYEVTITDFNGCTVSQTFTIIEPDSLKGDLLELIQPLCPGDNTGILEVGAIGGTAPFTYNWEHGATGARLENLEIGVYTVTVMDAKGCESPPFNIQLDPQIELDLNLAITSPPCVGPETGSILLQPQGVGPFEFLWEGGETTAQLSNIGVGDYLVNIQDGQGCSYDTIINLAAPQVFELDVDTNQPSCFGVQDGGFDVLLLSGGTGAIQIDWSDGGQGSERDNLGPGDYSFVISDAIGCTSASDTLTLNYPDRLRVITEAISPIPCTGDSTGFIETRIEGGTAPYDIIWVGTNVTGTNIFDLAAGDYRLRVTDANSCPIDTTFRVTEPDPLEIDVALLQGGGCDPLNAADTLVALISGGTAPYSYAWSTGDTTSILFNVPSGDYALTVTDAASCQDAVQSIKVRERTTPITLDKFIVEGPQCFGDNNVRVTAKINDGSGLYRYHFTPTLILDNVETDSVTVTTLPINNNYSVTITDLKTGCRVIAEREGVGVPPPLLLSVDDIAEIECAGGFDGGINVTVQGGIGPYQYSWRDGSGMEVSTDEDLNGVRSGTYTLYLEDANACGDTLMEEIPEVNAVISIDATMIDPVSCNGGTDGAIAIDVSGGEPPFRYAWSSGSDEQDIAGLAAGQYMLTITDADTCKAIFDGFVVEEPASAIMVEDTVRNILCFGDANGYIGTEITGGMPPYSYRWFKAGNVIEGELDSILTAIDGGNYTLEVRDTNDCIQEFDFAVDEPEQLAIGLSFTPPMPPNYDDGRATANASGGVPEYTYLWNTGADTSTIENLGPSTYFVTVTDANNCTREASILLTDSELPSWVNRLEIYPNPTRGQVFIDYELQRAEALELRYFNSLGQQIGRLPLEVSSGQQLRQDWSAWNPGLYWIAVLAEGKRIALRKIVVSR